MILKFGKIRPLITVPLVLLLVLNLIGCGEDYPPKVDNASTEPVEEATGTIVNPMKSSSYIEILDQMKYKLVPPQWADDLSYFIYDLNEDGKIAEMCFTYEKKEVYFRIKATSEMDVTKAEDISGLYFTDSVSKEVKVSNEKGILTCGDDSGSITWVDRDSSFICCLGMANSYSENFITKLATIVYDTLSEENATECNLINFDKTVNKEECIENGKKLGYTRYSTLSADEKYLDAYPNLSDILERYNAGVKEDCESNYKRQVSESREINSYTDIGYTVTLSYESDSYIMRADNKYLSIARDVSTYDGGAHGMYYVGGYTYDMATGNELVLSDIVLDPKALKQPIIDGLNAKYEEDTFWGLEDTLESYFIDAEAVLSWSLGYEGITFYFSPYELAAYAAGWFNVTVPFDKYPTLFNSAFTKTPKNYVVPFINGSLCGCDHDGDISNLVASLDEFNYYTWDTYLYHAPKQDYILICTSMNNGFGNIDVYTVDTEAICYMYSIDGVSTKCKTYATTLSNPKEINLIGHSDLIKPMAVLMPYSFLDNGYLVPLSDSEYDYVPGQELKLLKDMNELKKGTTLKPVKTDMCASIEAVNQAGETCKFQITQRNFWQSLDGLKEGEDDVRDYFADAISFEESLLPGEWTLLEIDNGNGNMVSSYKSNISASLKIYDVRDVAPLDPFLRADLEFVNEKQNETYSFEDLVVFAFSDEINSYTTDKKFDTSKDPEWCAQLSGTYDDFTNKYITITSDGRLKLIFEDEYGTFCAYFYNYNREWI